MATIDIWIIVYPADPNALALDSRNSVTVISMSPPTEGTIATSVYKTTVETITSTPTINQPTGDLYFVSDGDDWVAHNPTLSSSAIINISVPVESGESPETIPISFNYTPVKLIQNVGDIIIYVPVESIIYMINSEGETIGTINTDEVVSQINKTSSNKAIWIGELNGLFEIVDNVSSKITTLGNVLGFGTGSNEAIFIFDDYTLTSEEENNHRIRFYNSNETGKKIRLTDNPSYGCFSFHFDGNGKFIHGTSLNPEALSGYTFAVASGYDSRQQRQWRHEFTDWEYEDFSKETIVSASFDSDDNCYCVTNAIVGVAPVLTCDVRLATSTARSTEWTISSAFSTMTFDNGSSSGYNRIQFLNFTASGYVLKITKLEVYGYAYVYNEGLDEWIETLDWYDLSAQADWFNYSYVTYSGGFLFDGAPSYGSITTNKVTNISAIRLTFSFI